MTKGSDAPRVSSARTRPPNTLQQMLKSSTDQQRQQQQQQVKRSASDPRFSRLVRHGTEIKQNVESRYSFLGDIAQADQKKRQARMRALRRERKLREDERAEAEYEASVGRNKRSAQQQEEEDGDDNNDEEDEDDEDDVDDTEGFSEEERIRIGLMRDSEIQQELDQLVRASNKFKMLQGERKASESRSAEKRKWAKSQFSSVKAGKQNKPYFLNRKKMKYESGRQQLREVKKQGGQAAANSFVEKQMKRRFGAKHMTR